MRFRTAGALCAAVSVWLMGLVDLASARPAIFDSMSGGDAGAADTSIDPVISATFDTGSFPLHVDVALMLSAAVPEAGDSFTVSLDGGIPLADVAFNATKGLTYADGSFVDFQGPAIASVTSPLTSLSSAWTVKRYDEFAGVKLDPDSLYWIEVSVEGRSIIEWKATSDVSGPGVADNYLAWFGTNDTFFRNAGVLPFAVDQALEMEVDPVPEPSTWAMLLLGFAGVGFAGRRATRRRAASSIVIAID